jgi:glycosyltransferase involved in cell wall biosynthesis
VLSRLFRKPYTVVVHGLDVTYDFWLYRKGVMWTIKKADHITCISQAAARVAIEKGVPEGKISVVPLAVSDDMYGIADRQALLDDLSLPANSKILLTVGRLVKRKGVAWFVANVLPGLVKTYPDTVYLVVGAGPERAAIEKAAADNGVSKNVCLLGRVKGDLYAAAYNGADIFVMPNITVPNDMEGFGLVLLEAALCELPIVAANTEGVTDAVSAGQNGILVPVHDAGLFTAAVADFIADPVKARGFGKRARRYTLKNYQWEKVAGMYIERYKQLK